MTFVIIKCKYFLFRYRTDEQRIQESIINSQDYAKIFNFENSKLLTDDLCNQFDELNFIHYKGTDINKRQIFFLHLNRLNFSEIDYEMKTNPLIIYLSKCTIIII